MNTSLRLPVSDQSEAGDARRRAASWVREQAFEPDLGARVALVVTELATNLVLHTVGGEILVRKISTPEQRGVEVISLDRGPGVGNFSGCMRDGYSTAGTAGNGLGAIRRASHVFEVHSQPGIGTALLSELWVKPPALPNGGFESGAASVELAGQEACGDSWSAQSFQSSRPRRLRMMVADGLGHGELAATASRKAVEVFQKGSASPLLELLANMHLALRSTRGAALAVAEIDAAAGQLTYAGVGNIASAIVDGDKATRLMSHNGTIGAQYRPFKELTYAWPDKASLVMQSDGVKVDWQLSKYPGLAGRHPGLIAGVLYRDFRRTNDDATIVVLRERT